MEQSEKIQNIMWLVFEYAKIMDGAERLFGKEREKH